MYIHVCVCVCNALGAIVRRVSSTRFLCMYEGKYIYVYIYICAYICVCVCVCNALGATVQRVIPVYVWM